MRDDRATRGESGRVAERVRRLLDEHGDGHGGVRSEDDPTSVLAPVSMWQRLVARVPVRVDPGRRSALAVGAAVLVAAVVTGLWLMSSRPQPVAVSSSGSAGNAPVMIGSASGSPGASGSSSSGTASGASGGSGSPGAGGSSAPVGVVVVDVAGKVRRPGLYRLPTGARVDDAVRAAGGALRGVDLTALNLAAKLVDGQQIAVGRPGAVAPGTTGAGGSGGSGGAGDGGAPAGPVDLNTATLEQLETLPGIGPALGQRILDYRSAHGSFASVQQLDDVSGIGTVIFARLKPLVTT